MSELKVCRFCGKSPYTTYRIGRIKKYVFCSNRKCKISGIFFSIKQWNTRAEPKQEEYKNILSDSFMLIQKAHRAFIKYGLRGKGNDLRLPHEIREMAIACDEGIFAKTLKRIKDAIKLKQPLPDKEPTAKEELKIKLLRLDKPWNLPDIVNNLTQAVLMLLHDKDYDGHGYEETQAAVEGAMEWLKENNYKIIKRV